MRDRGLPVWLVCHERVRDELTKLFPGERRIKYIRDTVLHKLMYRLSQIIPADLAYVTTGFVSRVAVQFSLRRLVLKLVREQQINLVHQPMPVSPREPSLIFGFGVPVVIGPMNGGMNFPPAFANRRSLFQRTAIQVARWSSAAMNWIMPGKRRAALLLVANRRTRAVLPPGACDQVIEMVENGVDLRLWRQSSGALDTTGVDRATTFVFIGRLVDWKSVDLLLFAFSRAAKRAPIQLIVVGDGPERSSLEALARSLGILAVDAPTVGGVFFQGWLSQNECAAVLQRADSLVHPSLKECGGAVVLEAMATAKPVIATAWGAQPTIWMAPVAYWFHQTLVTRSLMDLPRRWCSWRSPPLSAGRWASSVEPKAVRLYDWEVKVKSNPARVRGSAGCPQRTAHQ